MSIRLHHLLVLAVGAALLAGCGGDEGTDSLSAEEYRTMLDAECARITADLEVLPERQQEEDLSSEEVEELGMSIGDEFEASVSELQPPAELEEAHGALVAAFDDPLPNSENLEEVRVYVSESARLYAELGAEGCEMVQRTTLRDIRNETGGFG